MRPHAADETRLPNSKSGRQNLAALGTTAGQNLAAVGSSHSLTETVDLGTMTAAGLVGTLHSDTPPMMKFYAQYRRCRHSNPCFYGTTQSYRCIITEKVHLVNHFFHDFPGNSHFYSRAAMGHLPAASGGRSPTSVKTRFFGNRVLTASPSREKPFG